MTLKDGLISWWTLDETSGTRVDSHGSNDLTDFETVLYGPGKWGNAADFEASNNETLYHVDNAELSFGNEDFTLACMVKAESLPQAGIMSKFRVDAGGQKREYLLAYNVATSRFSLSVSATADGSPTEVQANNLGVPSTGVWYGIIAWHDAINNLLGIQVNDGTVDTAAHSTGCNDGTAVFRVGAYYHTSAPDNLFNWDGLIDEPALWGRLLASGEKTGLWNGGNWRTYNNLLGGGNQVIIMASKFYKDLKKGLIPAWDLQRRYREVYI